MADKALYVVGQKRFVATMRKAGADLKQLKEVNRQAAGVALPAVKEHAQKEGWAAGDGSRIRQSYYMAYLAMRFAGNTSKPYDQWLDDVDDIDVETPENPTE